MDADKPNYVGAFLRWWLLFCLIMLTFGVLGWAGGIDVLLQKDVTFISFGIIGIFSITSIWIGKWVWRAQFDSINTDTAKFIAGKLVKLGLIGTIIGFIIMLDKMSGDFNFSNADDAAGLLAGMAAGMTAALYTTLTGLVCSALLKVQIRYLDILLMRSPTPSKSKRSGPKRRKIDKEKK